MEDINKINILELTGKTKRPEETLAVRLMQENLGNNNMLSDIGKLQYTKGYISQTGLFKPLTVPFCDNIMLAKFIDFKHCNGKYEKGKCRAREDICGTFNKMLRSKFTGFKIKLARWGIKAKSTSIYDSNNCKFLSALEKQKVVQRFNKPVFIAYKVDLADVCLPKLTSQLDNILQELRQDYYYLMDFDITQDFTGIFDKREMEEYLCEQHGFFKGKGEKLIVDNDKTVGMDCLTWVYDGIRAKIYNKFVCQVTSPGVIKDIGNHILDFIVCPDKRLRETFANSKAKLHGITRFEATIYNYGDLENYKCVLEENLDYFKSAPFYSVPVSKMWCKILDSVDNNMLVAFQNEIYFGLWGNSLTRKVTGYRVKLKNNITKEKMIKFVINAFSLNLVPIYCITINDDHTFETKGFVKSGCTYVTKGTSVFYSPKCSRTVIDRSGLSIHEKCNIKVFPSTLRVTSNLNLCDVTDFTVDKQLFVKKFRTVKREEENLIYLHGQQSFKETSKFDRTKYERWFVEKREQETLVKDIILIFRKEWSDPPQYSEIVCNAFEIRRRNYFKNGFRNTSFIIGVLGTVVKSGVRSVFYVKGKFKTKFIGLFSDPQLLIKEGFKELDNRIWFYPYGDFLVLQTKGLTSYNGHLFTEVSFSSKILRVDQECRRIIDVENSEMEDCLLSAMPVDKITVSSCRRLEQLDEGFEFNISFLGEKLYRKSIRYIFVIPDLEGYFVSNYWFEKLYAGLDKEVKLKCKLSKLATTPSNHMEMQLFLSNI